jgi:hypothetical protein
MNTPVSCVLPFLSFSLAVTPVAVTEALKKLPAKLESESLAHVWENGLQFGRRANQRSTV